MGLKPNHRWHSIRVRNQDYFSGERFWIKQPPISTNNWNTLLSNNKCRLSHKKEWSWVTLHNISVSNTSLYWQSLWIYYNFFNTFLLYFLFLTVTILTLDRWSLLQSRLGNNAVITLYEQGVLNLPSETKKHMSVTITHFCGTCSYPSHKSSNYTQDLTTCTCVDYSCPETEDKHSCWGGKAMCFEHVWKTKLLWSIP